MDLNKFKKLDSHAPEGAKQHQSVMTLEATVENTGPQKLKPIRAFSEMVHGFESSAASADLPGEGQIVLQNFFDVFEKQQSVKEGLVKDIVFGFTVNSPAGLDLTKLIVIGLVQLFKKGYIKFRAPDGTLVDNNTDHIMECWVQYEKKLLDLVYGS